MMGEADLRKDRNDRKYRNCSWMVKPPAALVHQWTRYSEDRMPYSSLPFITSWHFASISHTVWLKEKQPIFSVSCSQTPSLETKEMPLLPLSLSQEVPEGQTTTFWQGETSSSWCERITGTWLQVTWDGELGILLQDAFIFGNTA